MEFKKLIEKRRSVRKFSDQILPRAVIDTLLKEVASHAPSARNSRSTHFLVVDDRELLAKIAAMRDYGSAFVKDAPCVILVMADVSKSDLWRENAAIAATMLLLNGVDHGLSTCWVHVNGRPRQKDAPEGAKAVDYLRTLLPIPEGFEVLCAVAIGYSDFVPASLPAYDAAEAISWSK
ncbi:MAG: nitroreductase family protein [Alistipes sp.]